MMQRTAKKSDQITTIYYNNAFEQENVAKEYEYVDPVTVPALSGLSNNSSSQKQDRVTEILPSKPYTYKLANHHVQRPSREASLVRSHSDRHLGQRNSYPIAHKPTYYIKEASKSDYSNAHDQYDVVTTRRGPAPYQLPVAYDNSTGVYNTATNVIRREDRDFYYDVPLSSRSYEQPTYVVNPRSTRSNTPSVERPMTHTIGVQATVDEKLWNSLKDSSQLGEGVEVGVEVNELSSNAEKLPEKKEIPYPSSDHADESDDEPDRVRLKFQDKKLYYKVRPSPYRRALLGTERLPPVKRYCFNWLCVAFVAVCLLATILFPIIHFSQVKSGVVV